MKAVFVASPEGVVVKDVPAPHPKEDEIVVRMKVCGLCGSDLEKTKITYGMGSTKLGHEPVGEIIKVGNNVTGFRELERVFTHHHVPCYSCYYCSHNSETMCDSYQLNNLEPCGLSEEFPGTRYSAKCLQCRSFLPVTAILVYQSYRQLF